MELMDRGDTLLIDTTKTLTEHSEFVYPLPNLSPKSPTNRRQLPLRSLENTGIKNGDAANVKAVTMVCRESVDEGHHIPHKRQESQNTTNSQDSNSCPPISSHNCPYQKSPFSVHNQISCSTPNGLSHNMVRSTHSHLNNVECIYKNAENLKSDKKDTNIRIRTEAFLDFYVVEEEIGRGKFAVVKRCRHKTTGLKYAAKFLRKRRKGKDCRSEVLHEIKMLEIAIVHPRLVNMIEVFETPNEIIIITEYAEGGELFQRVCVDENFDEQESRRSMRQILEGVQFLHERNIVHLDIKPQNILLTSKSLKSNLKLCDLGFARPLHSGDDVRDIIGTPDYVAPEILSYEPIHLGSDMWSIGVLTYVILTGLSPFAGETKQETFLNVSQVNLDFPSEHFGHISKQAIDFISKLLTRNPEERLTARECLQHPWLQMTPAGSPVGQRRCLTPPSPDTLAGEPVKKCRCDIASPTPTPSSSCSHSCESCSESTDTDDKLSMHLSFDDTIDVYDEKSSIDREENNSQNDDTPSDKGVTEKCSPSENTTCRTPSPPPEVTCEPRESCDDSL